MFGREVLDIILFVDFFLSQNNFSIQNLLQCVREIFSNFVILTIFSSKTKHTLLATLLQIGVLSCCYTNIVIILLHFCSIIMPDVLAKEIVYGRKRTYTHILI